MQADNHPASDDNGPKTVPAAAATPSSATGRKTAWFAGIALGVAALGLTGVFMMHSGGKDVAMPVPDNRPLVVEELTETPVVMLPEIVVTPPATPDIDTAKIARDSLNAKMATVYRNGEKTLSSVFLDASGHEVAEGDDFAVQIGLFNRGNVSIDIVAGPHAGTRAGFFPVPADGSQPAVILEKIGHETTAGDHVTKQFSLLPAADRFRVAQPMKAASETAIGVSLPGTARAFVKTVEKNGRTATPIALRGEPEKDGVFEITIWNGDSYAMNLNTGDYSARSTFMNHPGWKPGQSAERHEVWGTIALPPAPGS